MIRHPFHTSQNCLQHQEQVLRFTTRPFAHMRGQILLSRRLCGTKALKGGVLELF